MSLWCSAVCLQVIWSTSPSWSHGASWRCWSTSMNGPVTKRSASLTSCFQCWNWSLRREPQLQSACATHGSPSSGDLQPLHLPSLPLSPETATDHFPVWAYQMNIYFSFCFVVLDFLCSCYWANASVYVCFVFVGSSLGVMTSGIQWIILLCGHVGSNCCSPFTHPTKKTCYCTASDSSLFVTLLH